jgi:hypothetical protein
MAVHTRAEQLEAKMRLASLNLAVAGALAALALSGCVVAPAGEEVGVAYIAPPPARVDVAVGVAPGPGYFWVGGNYFYERGAYVWHPGRWEAPRPGYRWHPYAWHHEGNAWHMRGGWVRVG